MKTEAPILILQGSKQPYLSIGVHTGGINFQGKAYYYMPQQDAFLQADYMKEYNKQRKQGKTWEQFIEYVKSI